MEHIVKELKKLKAKRVFVQFPEGLKLRIQKIAKQLERENFEVLLCMEPSFGACDIRDIEAKRLGCNAILHIAHSDFGCKSELPVIYWDYFHDVNPIPTIKKNIHVIDGYMKIGLITSIQFVPAMKKVQEYLESIGKEVFVHKTLKHPGQILGCNMKAAKDIEDKVECFLFVGAGKFHPMGSVFYTEKPVYSLNLETGEMINTGQEKKIWLKKKAWHEAQLKDARTVGILVSWKKGQNMIDVAMQKKRLLEKQGKEVQILAFDTIEKDKMLGLKFDCLINMACPRIDETHLWDF